MDRSAFDKPRAGSAPQSREDERARRTRVAPARIPVKAGGGFEPPTQPWDVLVSSLLSELDQRLGAMRSSWMAAETQRLRLLLDECARGDAARPDRVALLQQLAGLEPSLLAGEAEAAALIERCENVINRCGAASDRRVRDDNDGRNARAG